MEIEREALIRKFNQGKLSDKELLHLENLIIDEKISVEELEAFAMFNEISEKEQFNLDTIDNTFNEMLTEQVDAQKLKEKKLSWFKYVPNTIKYAFPAFLLVAGIFIGSTWKTETIRSSIDNRINLPDTESALISQILYAPSVSQKVQAMNHFDNIDNENQQINLLFFALNNDESNIVRVEAIDMVLKYANSEEVRARLINAIKEQKSPFIIQYLSEVLQEIGVGISLEKFRSLYNNEIPSEALEIMENNLHTL